MPLDACFCALAVASQSLSVAGAIVASATAATRVSDRLAGTFCVRLSTADTRAATKHAERSRRWRLRHQEQSAPSTEEVGTVTHPGRQEQAAELPGVSSDRADCCLPTNPDAAVQTQRFCPRCAGALSPWVRQGFLRRRCAVAGPRLIGVGGPAPPLAHSGDGYQPSRSCDHRV